MIISRTPFRISFFGGGTDYPDWYRQHGGAVLATTIDKYCYLSCRYLPPFFDYRYRVVWSKVENRASIAEIEHPVVRCLLQHMGFERGVEVHHVGDLPARSGMGSSSTFTVGLLHALHALQGRMVGKQDLMHEAIHVEQNLLRETVGSQDQVSAACGGFNKITFAPNGHIEVSPIVLRPGRLQELDAHLMLFYTGIVRTASKVATAYVTDLQQKRRQLRILRGLVDESIDLLASEHGIERFGELLDEGWVQKKSLGGGISNDDLDDVYLRARAAGAIGGKIAGAGGGGFLLLFVPPERQEAVRQALPELVHVPFRFESSGSQILFYDREQDFTAAEAIRAGQTIRAFRENDDARWTIPYPAETGPEAPVAAPVAGGTDR
ncbi:MAG: kinase [Planctomycetes bacterium]|nr:kinase [Planctomycetota bacterium]